MQAAAAVQSMFQQVPLELVEQAAAVREMETTQQLDLMVLMELQTWVAVAVVVQEMAA
jgi:hypothetical protein